jgi:hypothetical protein
MCDDRALAEPFRLVGHRGFVDDQHALLTGMVAGALLGADLNARPVRDAEGNYTAEVRLRLPAAEVHLLVLPHERPDEVDLAVPLHSTREGASG